MSADSQLAVQWSRICKRLRQELGDTAFRSWVQPLTVLALKDDEVQVLVPTRFMRDWVMTHYAERMRALWAGEDARVRSVNLMVAADRCEGAEPIQDDRSSDRSLVTASGGPLAGRSNGRTDGFAGTPHPVVAEAGRFGDVPPYPVTCGTDRVDADAVWEGTAALAMSFAKQSGLAQTRVLAEDVTSQSPLAAPAIQGTGIEDREDEAGPLDPRFTFDNFVVGKPNELAHAAARKVADAQTVTFNPLFLYSGVGLGKTHLMHAIAWAIRRKYPRRRVVYLSAERFMYQFIRALRFKDTVAFKEQYRSVDVLMIDDVQFISGKESTQEEFFHTFNALVDQNRQVVVSADKSPSDLDGMEERLKSRLGWGLVADIHPTTYELRLGVLHSKAEYLGVKVNTKVLEFLAHRITSNIRELEGALNRIIAHSELVGRPVTIEATQELLRDLLRANDRRVSIDEIQKKVAEHFKVRFADMVSSRRARVVARPRQVAMYLSKQLTPRSLPEIGRKFGGRDHTTVLHAVRKVEELIAEDVSFAEEVELLRKMLEA